MPLAQEKSKTSACPYFDMYEKDASGVSFEYWTDARSVDFHRHGFFELLIIDKGSCRHIYHGTDTLLIAGDAVIVPKHNAHGFSLTRETSVYNCQFLPEKLDSRVLEVLSGKKLWQEPLFAGEGGKTRENPPAGDGGAALWEELLKDKESYYRAAELDSEGYEPNSQKQGVIHLYPKEALFIRGLLGNVIENGEKDALVKALKKQKCMEFLLLEIHKAFQRQKQKYNIVSRENQAAIAEVLHYMEDNLAASLDFQDLAEKYGFSSNHFRKLFRDVTGFPPVKYLNRLRIIRACECIREQRISPQDAAASVGIIDMNYFSRLFKQIIGVNYTKLY